MRFAKSGFSSILKLINEKFLFLTIDSSKLSAFLPRPITLLPLSIKYFAISDPNPPVTPVINEV